MKIHIQYVFCTMTLIQARYGDKYCETEDPAKQCYVREVLASIAHSPNQLAVDRKSNSVYFSFDNGQGEYIPAKLDLNTKKKTLLKGVKDAFAIANDARKNEMYFGGSHGIFKYNPKNKTLTRLRVQNLDIWWLYVKKYVYFIKFPSLTGHCYKNRAIKAMKALEDISVHQFVLDKDENVFFINSTGLYGIRKDGDRAVLIRENQRFVGMALDNNGYVHVCSDDGIFIVRKMVRKLKMLINIQGVLGLTFDNENNLIYSDSHELVRLLPMYSSENKI